MAGGDAARRREARAARLKQLELDTMRHEREMKQLRTERRRQRERLHSKVLSGGDEARTTEKDPESRSAPRIAPPVAPRPGSEVATSRAAADEPPLAREEQKQVEFEETAAGQRSGQLSSSQLSSKASATGKLRGETVVGIATAELLDLVPPSPAKIESQLPDPGPALHALRAQVLVIVEFRLLRLLGGETSSGRAA